MDPAKKILTRVHRHCYHHVEYFQKGNASARLTASLKHFGELIRESDVVSFDQPTQKT
jgi:hypothetical protein